MTPIREAAGAKALLEDLGNLGDRGLLPERSWDGAVNPLRGTFALPGALIWWQRGKHVFIQRLQTWVEDKVVGVPARSPA